MQSEISEKNNLEKPEVEEVKEQLKRILRSEEFQRSPKISNFLAFIVNESLAGRQQYLKAHSIAVSVFDKDENFDPQTDPLVRVNAVRLRRMLRHYYASEGLKNDVTINVLKGSYVPRFYYRSKGDISTTKDVPGLAQHHSFPSIAVLSFKNLSQNLSDANFSNGITQEIVNQLTKFKELVVVARSSVNLTEDRLINARRLNKVIDVRYVLSGSVRVDDDNVRINVELDDSVTHTNVWAHAYNEKLSVKSTLAIQDEIAMHVATTIAQPYGVIIRKELSDINRRSTNHFSAYELFLHYFQFMRTLAPKDHKKARLALEEAVKIDPQFSDAWAALSVIYSQEYQLSMNQMKREIDVRELAYQTARHALKIDPSNSLSSFAISVAKWINGEVESSKEDAARALKLNPNNSLILAQTGLFLAISGSWEPGLEMLEQAMVMNPAHPDFYHFPFVVNFYRQDLYQQALQEANDINMPDYFWTHYIKAAIYGAMGNMKSAKQAVHDLVKLYSDIAEKARFELEKWDMDPELITKFLRDLKTAGLDVV